MSDELKGTGRSIEIQDEKLLPHFTAWSSPLLWVDSSHSTRTDTVPSQACLSLKTPQVKPA